MSFANVPYADAQIELDCQRFLYREAEHLDRRQHDEWLAMLHPDIDYKIPVRSTRLVKEGDGFSANIFFMKEDLGTIEIRIARLKTDFAWSENPATRVRRMVSNIRVFKTEVDDEFLAISSIAAFCLRGDATTPTILTGERQDVLARSADGLRLKKRLILLDATVLEIEALSFFL